MNDYSQLIMESFYDHIISDKFLLLPTYRGQIFTITLLIGVIIQNRSFQVV